MRSIHHVRRLAAVLCACLLLGVLLTPVSCKKMMAKHDRGMHETSSKKGPPPHAPAHGYRHKHRADDVELVFDSGRDVYIVVGFPGTYFFDGSYYRRDGQKWEMAFRLSGSWEPVASAAVPVGLAREPGSDDSTLKHPGKGNGKQKSK